MSEDVVRSTNYDCRAILSYVSTHNHISVQHTAGVFCVQTVQFSLVNDTITNWLDIFLKSVLQQ